MADNTTLNAGTGGDVIASDDVAGVKYQRVKPVHSADGVAPTDVSTSSGLPIQGAQPAVSTGSWTSATALNTAVSISVAGYALVSVAIATTSTFTGGVVSFEVSPDGTNWFAIAAARIDSFTTETTYTLVASTSRAWATSVDGWTNFRVRLSTVIAGTGTASVFVIPQAMPLEPIVTVGQATAGNLNATVTGTVATTMAANATTTPAKARDGVAGASDTGIPAFFVRRDTPTALTPVAGDFELAQIDQHGAQWVREKTSTTSAVTSVAASASNVTVLASNANRKGATIHNDSTAILYLKLGATASTSSFTVKMQSEGYYEVPANYTGIIDGLWSGATGSARVTELTS